MKTFSIIRLCAAALLTCITLALVACNSQGDTPTTPTTPTGAAPGPNAGLSNADLLSKALANMKALQSYHFEEKGGLPDDSFKMSPNTSIVGDIQASRNTVRATISDGSNHLEWIVTADGSHYESYDSGKTWQQPSGDTAGDYLIGYMGLLWNGNGPGGQIVGGANLKDGSPATEEIDGVYTKHMTADAGTSGTSGFTHYANGANSLNIWVSTDITPTIRQMRIEGGSAVLTYEVGMANSVAFSPDGKILAVAHEDRMVRVWNLTKPGSTPTKLKTTSGSFLQVAFSPDGKTLAAGVYGDSQSGAVYLWDTNNLDTAPTILNTRDRVRSIAFRPDGKMLAAGGETGLYLWDAPYKDIRPAAMPHTEDKAVYSIAFSPNSNTMATGTLDAGVRLYDTRHLDASPTALSGRWVPGLAFSPDGQKLAATTDARIWDLSKPGTASTILPGEGAPLAEGLAFSPDGQRLAARDMEDTIEIWSVSNPTAPPFVLSDGSRSGGRSIAFSPDGKTIATGSDNGQVDLWDMQNPGPASTPTVLKETNQRTNTPFTLTWKWSKFNEDLGEVKAPPTEIVKTP